MVLFKISLNEMAVALQDSFSATRVVRRVTLLNHLVQTNSAVSEFLSNRFEVPFYYFKRKTLPRTA